MSDTQTTARETAQEEAGFSLLELLLVVGVGALLLLAGIATYRLVTQGNNVNDAVRTLTAIKQQTQRAFQGQPNYGAAATDLVPTLLAMNAFPAGVVDTSLAPPQPIHPWGDLIQIAANVQTFTVTFVNVPSDSCIQLANTFNSADTDFFDLTIGGTTYPRGAAMDPTTITPDCTSAPLINMVWQFY